jgi:hypothetical protein
MDTNLDTLGRQIALYWRVTLFLQKIDYLFSIFHSPTWGRLASTWVQKQREQAELHGELLKHVQNVFANNDYALAA